MSGDPPIEAARKNVIYGAGNLVDVFLHRMQYGSPPLVMGSIGVPPFGAMLPLPIKQARIRRRREALGIAYQPYQPPAKL